ncbi:MAG: hypothetical protein NC923_02285 [Candidatus Omnitrophica bacterium]|nr:hypothetical protein [Candidatus Omnitrophota bacterium]
MKVTAILECPYLDFVVSNEILEFDAGSGKIKAVIIIILPADGHLKDGLWRG